MESLQVRVGQVSLRILDDNGDERGIFKFNPEDIECARRVLEMQQELDVKYKEFEEQSKACKTVEEQAELMSTAVKYFRTLVDRCFGSGSSDIVFGDANTLTMFYDFFEGIAPYFEKASKKRMDKYRKKK